MPLDAVSNNHAKAPIIGDWWTCISCEKPIRLDGTCEDGCPYDGKRDMTGQKVTP